MKTASLIIPSLLLFITLSAYNTANHLKQTNTAQPNIPSVSEIGSGLKEALLQGTGKSSDQLSAVDGYFGNPSIKILFPPQAQKAEKKLRQLGLNKLCDNVILSLNRSAEDAAKQAKPIFIDAIKYMRLQVVTKLLLALKN